MLFKDILAKSILYASAEENKLKSKFTALLGYTSGLVASSIIIHYIPVPSSGLKKAKELGIVSLSVIEGYNKSQDTIYFVIAFFITLIISISIWLAWAIASASSAGFEKIDKMQKIEVSSKAKLTASLPANRVSGLVKLLEILLVLIIVFILTYNKNFFYSNWFNHYTFFSEEGQHLSYANDILLGKKLYKDIYAIYGPLMEYPLAFLMKLLGKSILTLRVYTYFLDFIGFLLIYFLSKEIFSRKSTLIISMLIFFSFYTPLFPAPNGSILRVTLGLFGVFPLVRYIITKKSIWATISGLFLSLSIFFSHETGLCLAISFFCMLFASKFFSEFGDRKILTGFSIPFFSGFCLIAIPIILFFLYEGTLLNYLKSSISYPQYVSLGFGGIPFPNLLYQIKALLNNFSLKNIKDTLFVYAVYWPVVLYFGIATHILINAIQKKITYKKLLIIGILIYGITLFKGALARSGIDRNYLLLPPVLFLALFYSERALLDISYLIKRKVKGKSIFVIFYSCVFIFAIQGIFSYAVWPAHWSIEYFFISNLNKLYKLDFNAVNNMDVLKIPHSGNIRLPRAEAEKIKAVVEYVGKYLSTDDYIFVFPNEATYYFLLDRPTPARFGVLHDAATSELKNEVVENLKTKKPKFVINCSGEWQVDRIPEKIEFPQILKYININYILEKEIQGVKILKRKD